jgi:hypothetical protein
MERKPIVFVILILVLLLSVTVASARDQQSGVNLDSRAKDLAAQKYGIGADALQPVGKAAKVKFPLQGITAYDSKFIDGKGNVYAIAVNTEGQEVSIETLSRAEKAAHEARDGKLDKNLATLLRTASPDAKVEVDIWLVDNEGDLEADLVKPVVDASANQKAYPSRSAAVQAAPEESVSTFDAKAWEAQEQSIVRTETARMEALIYPRLLELRRHGYIGVSGELSPVITVTLPVRVIREWSKRADVDIIYKSATLGNEINIARQAVEADHVNSQGIKGNGSDIAVVEYGGMVSSTNPYLSGTTIDNPFGCWTESHPTGIAGIIRSTKATYQGIAPRTDLWVGCGNSNSQIYLSSAHGVAWGADSFSLSWYSDYTRSITTMDKFYDKFPLKYIALVIKSAGNRGDSDGIVTSPGIGFNTLAVGAYNDVNTDGWGDDYIDYYSSYVDPFSTHGDREKPEVAAPGTNIMSTTTAYPWIGDIGSGTSYAAPIVAGISSLLYQRAPALTSWPESTKAILMASAWENLEGAAALSEYDGAGGVDAYYADLVAQNSTWYGGWGSGNYYCATGSYDIGTMYLYTGFETKVAVVWDQNPWYWDYVNRPSADLDITIYDPTWTSVAGSWSWDNTYETVQFTPAMDGVYTVHISQVRCDANPKYIGWAWSSP